RAAQRAVPIDFSATECDGRQRPDAAAGRITAGAAVAAAGLAAEAVGTRPAGRGVLRDEAIDQRDGRSRSDAAAVGVATVVADADADGRAAPGRSVLQHSAAGEGEARNVGGEDAAAVG